MRNVVPTPRRRSRPRRARGARRRRCRRFAGAEAGAPGLGALGLAAQDDVPRTSGGMPRPVSLTVISTQRPSGSAARSGRRVVTVTLPAAGVSGMALSTQVVDAARSTWKRSKRQSGTGSRSPRSVTPWRRAMRSRSSSWRGDARTARSLGSSCGGRDRSLERVGDQLGVLLHRLDLIHDDVEGLAVAPRGRRSRRPASRRADRTRRTWRRGRLRSAWTPVTMGATLFLMSWLRSPTAWAIAAVCA